MTLLTLFRKQYLPSPIHEDSGQALIEMAIVLPTFFLLTLGFIDFCLIVFSMSNANFASRAALRYACTHSSASYLATTQQGLNNVVAPFIFKYPTNTYIVTAAYGTISGNTINNTGGTNTIGSPVSITLTISYTFSVLGSTYSPISYSSSGYGIIEQ